ncbi:MAG: hypothetical protein ABIL09_11185 [Gemmatimonadota bacterium]
MDDSTQIRLVPRPWYEHPAFVGAVAAVAAIGVTLGVLWAAGEL